MSARDLIVRFSGALAPSLKRSAADARREVGSVATETEKTSSRGASAAKKAAAIGGGALLAVGVGLKKSADAAGGFEKSMNLVGVQTKTSGAQLKQLTKLAIDMGAKTSFSAQGAADAMVELAKGGLTQAQIKAGALQETLTLATAGGLELGDAASYMVQGLTAFGLNANQAGQVAAALAGGANASTASVQSLGLALSQVGPGAKTAGLTLQDTTAALAAFDNAGLKGSDAGTSLKTFLTRLVPTTLSAQQAMMDYGLVTVDAGKAADFLRSKGIKPLSKDQDVLNGQLKDYATKLSGNKYFNTEAVKTYLKLGRETGTLSNAFFDAKGKIKDVTHVSEVLAQALKGQTKEQKIAALATLFGSDASRAAAVLADNGAKGLAKYVKAVNDKKAAEALAANATKGFQGAQEALSGGLETLQIQAGTYLLPVLTKLTNYVAKRILPAVGDLVEYIGPKLEPAFKRAQGVVLGLVDRFKSLDLSAFQGALSVAGDKVKAFFSAVQNLDMAKVQAGFQVVVGAVKEFTSSLPAAEPIVSKVGTGLGFLADHADLVAKALPFLIAGFAAYKAAQAANALVGRESLIGFVAQLGTTIALTIANRALTKSTDSLLEAQGRQVAVTNVGFFAQARNTVATIASAAAQKAAAVGSKLFAAGQWLVNAALTANPIGLVIVGIAALVAGLIIAYKKSETFRKIVQGALGGVVTAFHWLVDAGASALGWIKKHWSTIVTVLGGPVLWAARLIASHWGTIRAKFTAGVVWVKGAFSKTWAGVQHVLTLPIRLAANAIAMLLGKKGLRKLFADAVGAVGRIWMGIQDLTKKPVKFIIETVLNGGLISAFNSVVDLLPGDNKKLHIPDIPLPRGWKEGGYTGRGNPNKIAGPAHFDEQVIRSRSRRRLEAAVPGGLDYLNRTGRWPVGPAAERGGADQQARRGMSVPVKLAAVPGNLRDLAARGPRRNERTGFGGPVDYGLAQVGQMGWYNRCLAFVNAAWNYTVGRFRLATARQSMNAGPRTLEGMPPAGAGVYWDTGPSGHIALAVGDGSVLSNDIRAAGRIDRVPQQEINKWGPYRGWWHPNGTAGGSGPFDPGSGSSGPVGSVIDYVKAFKSKITGAMGRLAELGGGPVAQILRAFPTSLASTMTDKAKSFLFGSSTPNGGAGDNLTMGHNMMLNRGFPEQHWQSLFRLWQGESNWNEKAENASSGAYGIPQALPGSKMASSGPDWRTNPGTQIDWGLKYIRERYGNPTNAYSSWLSRSPHWYDNGGWLPTGPSLVMNGTGHPEPVFTSGQWDDLKASKQSGDTYEIHFHGVTDGDGAARAVRSVLDSASQRRSGVQVPLRTKKVSV